MQKTLSYKKAILCPKCYKVLPIEYKVTVKDLDNDELEVYGDNINIHYLCPNCKKKTKFVIIDKDIVNHVVLMNMIDYHTAYSCQGHFHKEWFEKSKKKRIYDIGTVPYIMVKGKKHLKAKLLVELMNIGWDSFSIGQCKNFVSRVKHNKPEDYHKILGANIFSFRYDIRRLQPKLDEWLDAGYDVNKIGELFEKELKKMRKDLLEVLERYYFIEVLEKKTKEKEGNKS